MKLLIIALGSRGDVQPYVALGVGFRRAGYDVSVCAGDNFADFITARGLGFIPIGVDVENVIQNSAIAQEALDSRMNFIKGASKLVESMGVQIGSTITHAVWEAIQDFDLAICSQVGLPAMAMARRVGIPAFPALPYPFFSPTRAFPDPVVPVPNLSGTLNYISYHFVNFFVNILLKKMMEGFKVPDVLEQIESFPEMHARGQPFLYGFSEHVVPRPPEWGPELHVTGHWFLDRPAGWEPPADLCAFLKAGPKPVYVGFGSISSTNDYDDLIGIILEALERAGLRAVIATGWGKLKRTLPADRVYAIRAIPHDWLFPRMAAVVHHGGAGTTAAGLRAGIPSLVIPFMGDQPFWSRRVKALGVGPEPIPKWTLTADKLAYALRIAASHGPMRERAAALGENIRAEDGVGRAVEAVNRYML
jgi:sterol 3beta-glucosyltransferase